MKRGEGAKPNMSFCYVVLLCNLNRSSLFKNQWDSVQLNHPYGTSSKFPEQAKEK